jgi:hypothetical protein
MFISKTEYEKMKWELEHFRKSYEKEEAEKKSIADVEKEKAIQKILDENGRLDKEFEEMKLKFPMGSKWIYNGIQVMIVNLQLHSNYSNYHNIYMKSFNTLTIEWFDNNKHTQTKECYYNSVKDVLEPVKKYEN